MTDFFNNVDYSDKQRRFYDFFDAPIMPYRGMIQKLIEERDKKIHSNPSPSSFPNSFPNRFIVNINDLRQYNRELSQNLIDNPLQWFPPMESALDELVKRMAMIKNDNDSLEIHIGLVGSFGSLHTTPRHLSSKLLGKMICLDGLVTSCSLVRPKLLKSVHYSQRSKIFLTKDYYDATMLIPSSAATGSSYPTEAGPGDTLQSEFGLSTFRDYQTISMQEMPERAPAGQLPRSIDIVMDGDLVDQAKPGDRIRIFGVYRALTGTGQSGSVPASFRSAIIANNVVHLTFNSNSKDSIDENSSLVNEIKNVAHRQDVFDLLSRSIAPSIYGHDWIKRAVLLMLLGGVEKNLVNGGTHIRGDINILMVGDPSTAKSQILRFVLGLAPLAIATTGRGSSGVGLTAAVTLDKETGEKRLEAGAMVLADRGVVCIDEFDKMNDMDRVAIHEVMEQQTVTIAKAGIHTSLNARCSVLAAANPIWGQYRESESPQENIRLPDSLLSRFDLLFIVLDHHNPEHDTRIAEHVLKMHRWLPVGLNEGDPIHEGMIEEEELNQNEKEELESISNNNNKDSNQPLNMENEKDLLNSKNKNKNRNEKLAASIFIRRYAQSSTSSSSSVNSMGNENELDDEFDYGNPKEEELVSINFLRKYIQYARDKIHPVLTKNASEQIVSAYTEFRQNTEAEENNREKKTFPVTPRTLETLIRLATAHAKSRLSSRVERRDALVAQEMIEYCLYKKVQARQLKKKKKNMPLEDERSDQERDRKEDQDREDYENDNQRNKERNAHFDEIEKSKENISPSLEQLYISNSSLAYEKETLNESNLEGEIDFIDLSQDQSKSNWKDQIKVSIDNIRNNTGFKGILTVEELRSALNSQINSLVSDSMMNELLEEMQSMNNIMYRNGIIYIV